MEKLNGQSMNLTENNIDNLKQIFPEVFTEGKIDFNKLKLVLGDSIETNDERYEFRWNGKNNAIKIAQTPSMGTLRPDKDSSKNWDNTENLYIEGDNLEVLKLLQKSYFGKVKMIYIDPPYNTGKDFVYKDNFRDNIANYKELTNQTTKANPETNGRYHTDWLNMMYPRLKLARNLLREDGAIFISIDDIEVTNLKKICDEVFGEDNFITNIIWQKKFARQNDATYFSTMHDNILCYAKRVKQNKNDKHGFDMKLLPRTEEDNANYKNPDNDPRGVWISVDFSAKSGTESLKYEIETSGGMKYIPADGRFWSTSKENLKKLIDDNRIWFGAEGKNRPRIKTFLSEVQNGMTPNTIWFHEEVSHTQASKQKLKKLFDDKDYFDTPKPVELMHRIVYLSTEDNDLVLDFFSGSCTTAHAVMQLNSEDTGNRKFIMVQLPEITDEKSEAYKAGYKNICEIGKERIRRAGEKIVSESGKTDLDIGFKVFKLDDSNIKEWNPNYDELAVTLEEMTDNLKSGRTKEDLLFEILIKMGIELTSPIQEVKVEGKTIFNIGMGSLMVCLEDEITDDVIKEIPKHKSEFIDMKVVFKETGFESDSLKMNAMQNLKQFGITDVRSV
ncbi:site-specific DNA-methyltransferase [Clostridioides difficile]